MTLERGQECHHFFQLTLDLHLSVFCSCSHHGPHCAAFTSHTHTYTRTQIYMHKNIRRRRLKLFTKISKTFNPHHHHPQHVVSTSLSDPPPLWTEMDAPHHCSSTTPFAQPYTVDLLYYSSTIPLHYTSSCTTIHSKTILSHPYHTTLLHIHVHISTPPIWIKHQYSIYT